MTENKPETTPPINWPVVYQALRVRAVIRNQMQRYAADAVYKTLRTERPDLFRILCERMDVDPEDFKEAVDGRK